MSKISRTIIGLALSGLFLLFSSRQASAFVIDHNTVDASAIPQSWLNQARNLSVFFNHKSIGGNILDGIADLQSQDSVRYTISVQYSSGTSSGINEYRAGSNGEPLSKINGFGPLVKDGHNIAFMKFCTGDCPCVQGDTAMETVWARYRDMMVAQQSEHPSTELVWWTWPLISNTHSRAYCDEEIQGYNDNVRDYVNAHGGTLFDLAAITSHDPDGNPVTYDGYEAAWPAWTSDGSHLNTAGRQRVASALWWMMARLAGWDGTGTPSLTPTIAPSPTPISQPCQYEWSDDVAHDGDRSLNITKEGSVGECAWITIDPINVTGGADYTLSGWIRTEDVNGEAFIEAIFVDSNGLEISRVAVPGVQGTTSNVSENDFVERTISTIAPANAVGAFLQLSLYGTGSSWYDEIVFTQTAMASNSVNVVPQSQLAVVGDHVEVDIFVTDISGLFGYQFDFSFNPAILSFTDFLEGTFIGGADETFWVTLDDSEAASGVLRSIAVTRITPGQSVSGSGILGSFGFTAISSGTAVIQIDSLQLTDIDNNPILFSGQDGMVLVSVTAGTPTNFPTPTPGISEPTPTPSVEENDPIRTMVLTSSGCYQLGDGAVTLASLECVFENAIKAFLGLAAIILFVIILVAGFKYTTSGGDPKAVQSAKMTLTYAIGGIVLIVLSFLILQFISVFTGADVTEFTVAVP